MHGSLSSVHVFWRSTGTRILVRLILHYVELVEGFREDTIELTDNSTSMSCENIMRMVERRHWIIPSYCLYTITPLARSRRDVGRLSAFHIRAVSKSWI